MSRYVGATSLAFLLATPAAAGEESTTQIGPSDGTPLAKQTAKEEVTVDPISPDALREATEAFEARKSFDAEVTSAQHLRRNASPSGEKARDQIPTYVSPQPPKDVHSHQGTEATTVSVPVPESRPATALKAKPGTKQEELRSPARPNDPYTLDFVGSHSVPGPGVDPLIEAQRRKQKGGETYAFLMMDSFPDARVVEKLTQFGVKALGPHGTTLKVRIPLSDQTLAEIARLPGFRSLSYASIDQKFSPDLKGSAERLAKEAERLPVIVNLFDSDDDGRFATQMRGTGAEIGHYDAQLRSYQALATPDQLRALAALDFVLFLEIERRGGGGHDQSMATNRWITSAAPVFLGAEPCWGCSIAEQCLGALQQLCTTTSTKMVAESISRATLRECGTIRTATAPMSLRL